MSSPGGLPADGGSAPADPLQLDSDAARWVETTCAALSTEQKIAQLFVLSSRYDTAEEVQEITALGAGGVHRFPGDDFAAAWEATRVAIESSDVPVIISGDVEGGALSYSFVTETPSQLGIAACNDIDLSERLAEVIARESRALGIDWSFSPVVDINTAWRNPAVGTRSYGSDPATVLEQGLAYIAALQRNGIAATAKHWPGDGVDDRDQHLLTSVNSLPLDEWQASYGKVFGAMIGGGVMTVMSSHIALPAFIRSLRPDAGREAYCPASVSDLLNRVLLRERLGFRGLVVSDATVMGGLTSWADRAEAVPGVIQNGCDVFLFSRDPAKDMRLMLDGLRTGKLTEDRLEEAVTRMLSLKAKLGLHRRPVEDRLPPLELARNRMRRPESVALSAEAAGRSVTLVKDTAALLPLDPQRHRRVVLISDQGWNFVDGAPLRDFSAFASALVSAGFDVRQYDPETMPTSEDTDLVIYLLGQEATPSVGSIRMDFTRLHGGSRKAMVQFNAEIPTAIVSFGQPYFLYDAPNHQTCVNAYCNLPMQQQAVVERLLGRAPFEGRSPVDPFCGIEQLRY